MNWGEEHLERLILREQLNYWRKVQNCARPEYALDDAKAGWDEMFRDSFVKSIQAGLLPNIVSGFFETVPGTKIDLRAPAIEHDIAYTLGGSEQARRNADDTLYWAVMHECQGNELAKSVVAAQVWIWIRTCGWHKHFYYC